MRSSDRERKTEEIFKKLDETPAGQMAAASVEAIIELIPFVGGAFATIARELIPNWKLQRLQKFVAALGVDLKELEATIDVEYLKREEFGYLFEKTFRAVMANYQTEKLDALRNVLLNSMLRTDVDQDIKEYFLGIVENLGRLHIRVLRAIDIVRRASPFDDSSDRLDRSSRFQIRAKSGFDSMSEARIELLMIMIPELEGGPKIQQSVLSRQYSEKSSIITAIWNDLHNYGILNKPLDSPTLGVRVSLGPREILGDVLSEFGLLLEDFIKSPQENPRKMTSPFG